VDFKDLLPLLGIVIGWGLAEGSAFGKRAIERRRVIGRAMSLVYFVFREMVQVKLAQEHAKNQNADVKEWERRRQHSFAEYTVGGDEHAKRLASIADELGAYYPIEAYHLRHILFHYEFVKSKKLDAFTAQPIVYLALLGGYETGYLRHQYELELLLRFLAYRQSKVLWIRVRHDLWRMRRSVPKGDLVFLQQIKGFRKKRKGTDDSVEEAGSLSEAVQAVASSAMAQDRALRKQTPTPTDNSNQEASRGAHDAV
jgi:hypothetical protein